MITYKVVTEQRQSIFVNFIDREKYPEHPYTLIYNKGEIVTAIPDSLGIMTFDTIDNAETFITDTCRPNNPYILRVEKVGKQFKHILISRYLDPQYLKDFYQIKRFYNVESYCITYPPKGTLFFESIKVLD